MNIKKTAAVLAALAMAGSVCLPVSAENETDAEVMTVYYDHTDAAEEESAEDVQVFSEEEGEYTPGETEDTAVTTDNTASYDTDSDLVSVAY
ncbi:MAG: hypothetical protein J6X85_08390, partial [Ruminococcus sp.]|nr:hypothetical protein [Ruminococcus sp.]